MFTFDEKNHRYTLDDKPLTGVTTILGVIAKPALIQWSANQSCQYVKEHLKNLEDLDKVLAEAKNAHRKKKEKAGDLGTLAHEWIEAHIKGQNPPDPEPNVKKMTDNFLKWESEVKPKYLESELRVYSRKYWYAGTLDLMLEIDGEVYLGDIKTSSGIYNEHFWQTSAYQIAVQEMGKYPEIKGHIIINLKKDGRMDIKKSYEYPEDRKAFLGALAIYRRINQLK